MAFRQNAYCKVWEVKPGNGNYTDVRLNTSKKNKQTGEYEQDFGGYVRFIGTAHQMAANLKEGDRIKIGDCEVTNRYDKEKKVTYTNFAVFSFEFADGNSSGEVSSSSGRKTDTGFMEVPDSIDEELPFA